MTVALTSTQVLIVGLVAMFLTWFLALVIEKGIPWFLAVTRIKLGVTIDLGRFVKTLLVGVSAFLLAWWWYPAVLPALPVFVPPFGNEFAQFAAWVPLLLASLSPYVGAAMTIYNLGNEFAQFAAWVPLLLASLSPYVGAAMTIYNLILGYLLDPEKRKQILLALIKMFSPGVLPVPPSPPTIPPPAQ